MIILIAGASHTGKTLLAQRLLEQYKYPYLSMDHLKMGLIRSGNTDLTPMDDDKLTDYLWPITREMIKTAIKTARISLWRAATFLLTGSRIFLRNTWSRFAIAA